MNHPEARVYTEMLETDGKNGGGRSPTSLLVNMSHVHV
jgi:hypothetical protein